MSKGWDFDTGSGGGNNVEYTKFPEGITKIRVVDATPNIRWIHWINSLKRSINCPGRGCPICEMRKNEKANKMEYTHNMSRRFALQVLNRNTGKLEMMEQGVTFFQDLKDIMEMLDEKGKKLIDVDISVKRRGTGKDSTSYRIDIDEEYPLTDADKKLIEGMVDMDEYFKVHEPEKIIRVLQGEDWKEVMYDEEVEDDKEEEFELE